MTIAIDSSIARAKNFDLNSAGDVQKGSPSRAKNVDQKGFLDLSGAADKRSLQVGSAKKDPLEQITEMIMTIMESLMKMISSLVSGANADDTTKAKSGDVSAESKKSAAAGPLDSADDIAEAAGVKQQPVDGTSVEETTPGLGATSDLGLTKPAVEESALGEEETVDAVDELFTRSQQGSTAKKSAASKELASSSSVKESAPTKAVKGMQALTDETGAISVLTEDGFTVKAEGKDQAWTIAAPDGATTRIWGDPHVYESDGNKWDFKDQSTFKFGKNKVTVETVPAGNGQNFSARLTVYSGDERVTIDGLQTDKPTLRAVSADGKQHDASLSDGTVYERGVTTRGESWATVKGGKRDVQGV